MKRIDLNVDIGEGQPHDEALLEYATSANVCCGEHAGSWDLTGSTVELCLSKGVRVGAHPGYPDRETMGRASIDREHERAYLASVHDQVSRFSREFGSGYVKPHGALYNDTAVVLPHDWEAPKPGHAPMSVYQSGGMFLAQFPGINAISMLLRIHRLPLMGLAATSHAQIAERAGQRLISEGFADRGYLPDGTLKKRGQPGAIFEKLADIRAQALTLAAKVDSICLHGDTPGCVEFAETVYATLRDAGYEVRH